MTFNDLQARIHQMQQLNQELENRVRERTAELEHLNEQLQNEIAQHQQTLNTLRLSEERFRQLAENIREVFWMVLIALR